MLADAEIVHTPAPPGLRFANYLIDIIIYYLLMFLIGILGAGMINPGNKAQLYFIAFLTLIGYYLLPEGATGGKTIGKFITKTRAVKEDGNPISFGDAAVHTVCRLVPFEPFSTFGGRLWHDKWTKTMVIKE